MQTKVNIVDRDELARVLKALGNVDDPTNWVLLGYGEGKNDIVVVNSGSGGIDEFKAHINQDDKIFFGLLETMVAGDEYNTVKRVLVTWIGSSVPAGLAKARAAGHRTELKEVIKEWVSVASEYQTARIEDINFDNIAQTLTRMRPSYHTSTHATTERKQMSEGKHGTSSKLIVLDEDTAKAGLKQIFDGTADWAMLAYVEGREDEVELIETGTGGLEALKERFPTNRIYFVMLSLKMPTGINTESVTKYILLSLVGTQVKPLQKARSGGQRKEIQEFIQTVLPVNAHYQPGGPSDLDKHNLLTKFV